MPQAAITPRLAIDNGFALLPADRQGAGGVDSLAVVDNMFLPDIDRFFRGGRMRNREMVRAARALGARFEVRPNDPSLKLSALSGGNAQKVLIARWMNRAPLLLLLDEPTQGVDVGTRQQIFAALRTAAEQGMSVICASSEAEQLALICDRVLVFGKGRIIREIAGEELSKDVISDSVLSLGRNRPPAGPGHRPRTDPWPKPARSKPPRPAGAAAGQFRPPVRAGRAAAGLGC